MPRLTGDGGAERTSSSKPTAAAHDEDIGRRQALVPEQHGQFSVCNRPRGTEGEGRLSSLVCNFYLCVIVGW